MKKSFLIVNAGGYIGGCTPAATALNQQEPLLPAEVELETDDVDDDFETMEDRVVKRSVEDNARQQEPLLPVGITLED